MRRGAAAPFLVLSLTWAALTPGPAAAQGTPSRQVLLYLTGGLAFDEALEDPTLSPLVRGGAGMMTNLRAAEKVPAVYVTIGAGRAADGAPEGPVPFSDGSDGLVVDAAPYARASGDARVGFLSETLAGAGHTVGYADLRGATGDPAMLVAMDPAGRIPVVALNRFPVLEGPFLVPDAAAPFEEADLVVSPDLGSIAFALETSPADEVLLIVAGAAPSADMRARGEEVTAVMIARGAPEELLAEAEGGGAGRGLTSDTTRHGGIVANVDVAPTVLEFLGVEVPGAMTGSAIRIDGEVPRDLHERFLEYQRIQAPLGLGVLGLAIVALLAGFGLALSSRPSKRVRRVVATAGLFAVALVVSLLPGSVLPTFAPAVAFPAVGAAAGGLTMLAIRLGRDDTTRSVAVIAAAGLGFAVADALLGWPTSLTPLLGGGAFEGVRFYGIGNSYAGVVLSGAVLAAAHLGASTGVVLLAVTALFTGLPFIGADFGGGVTLGAVAALWYVLRSRGRVGWPGVAIVTAGGLAMAAALVLFSRLSQAGHVARAAAGGGVVGTFFERLVLNIESTNAIPFVWIPVLALPVWLWVARAKPGRFRAPLERWPGWRDAVSTLCVGGIIGYVLNDTFGMAAIAFVFVSGALLLPGLASRWNG